MEHSTAHSKARVIVAVPAMIIAREVQAVGIDTLEIPVPYAAGKRAAGHPPLAVDHPLVVEAPTPTAILFLDILQTVHPVTLSLTNALVEPATHPPQATVWEVSRGLDAIGRKSAIIVVIPNPAPPTEAPTPRGRGVGGRTIVVIVGKHWTVAQATVTVLRNTLTTTLLIIPSPIPVQVAEQATPLLPRIARLPNTACIMMLSTRSMATAPRVRPTLQHRMRTTARATVAGLP